LSFLLDASETATSSGLLVQLGVRFGQQVLAHLCKVKLAVVLARCLVSVAEDKVYQVEETQKYKTS